ncbi:DUF3156 family protein [Serratia sp. JUb9]|uniref:DUF3156 family protein n=1 Tax=unclassified Serratia (in: enterobacteria) TaxID=2647522 RepID=UPI000CF72359|nr:MULTISPECIES: DUF3156 family protein [unclassified Serratia (in: enterobacteria)]AVJ16124.1 hypothetical protein CLM71_02730 [Serratia sp. MYb239]MCA4824859.1 DUF3156 family protein [Serratia rubidaea]QNK31927.1 DUF3156 family protein [Serratia sp. JUb9]SQJ29948.1 Protein of uncharacterised function (DUF3156) [Serratia rubidaea]
MIALRPSVNRVWQREPAGYRAGSALDRLQADLRPYACERLSAGRLCLTLPQGPQLEISERPQALFLAHIVSHRFSLSGRTALTGSARLTVRGTGWWRQRGVRYCTAGDEAAARQLTGWLARYPQIGATLAQLDFRHAQLTLAAGRWQFSIEHFAACEVVSRLPPGRRYLRLTAAQRCLLLSACLMVAQLMEKIDD